MLGLIFIILYFIYIFLINYSVPNFPFSWILLKLYLISKNFERKYKKLSIKKKSKRNKKKNKNKNKFHLFSTSIHLTHKCKNSIF